MTFLSSDPVTSRDEVNEIDRIGAECAGKVETSEAVLASKMETIPVLLATTRKRPSGLCGNGSSISKWVAAKPAAGTHVVDRGGESTGCLHRRELVTKGVDG